LSKTSYRLHHIFIRKCNRRMIFCIQQFLSYGDFGSHYIFKIKSRTFLMMAYQSMSPSEHHDASSKMFFYPDMNNKETAMPITGRECPENCETSRLQHFLDNWLIDDGEVVSLICRLPFTPSGRFLVLISLRG
jgi:hypothetical protein